MRQGRPPVGLGHVDRLEGPDDLKVRLRILLATITGDMGIDEACAELGVSPSRLHEMRKEALEGALTALTPGRPGRPRTPVEDDDRSENELALKTRVRELEVQLQAAFVRTELALAMPHLFRKDRKKKQQAAQEEAEKLARASTEREAAWEHMDRLGRIAGLTRGMGSSRRGFPRQRRRRQAERIARGTAVVFVRWQRGAGRTRRDTARQLAMNATTLTRWTRRWRENRMSLAPRGRTVQRTGGDLRRSILTEMTRIGPRAGIRVLRAVYPNVARAELEDLRRRCWRLAVTSPTGSCTCSHGPGPARSGRWTMPIPRCPSMGPITACSCTGICPATNISPLCRSWARRPSRSATRSTRSSHSSAHRWSRNPTTAPLTAATRSKRCAGRTGSRCCSPRPRRPPTTARVKRAWDRSRPGPTTKLPDTAGRVCGLATMSRPRASRPTRQRAPGEPTGPLHKSSGNKDRPSPPKSGVCSWRAVRRMLYANATRGGSAVAQLSTTTSKPTSIASPSSVLWSSTAICNSGGGDFIHQFSEQSSAGYREGHTPWYTGAHGRWVPACIAVITTQQ